MLLVLAGPSGVGKGTIVAGLRARVPGLWVSVSYTTRPARAGEVEGRDYHFVTRAEFEALRDAGGFVEWFEVYGDLKGTPRGPVEEHLAAGDDVLLEIDVQGALKVRDTFPRRGARVRPAAVARGAAAAPRLPGDRVARATWSAAWPPPRRRRPRPTGSTRWSSTTTWSGPWPRWLVSLLAPAILLTREIPEWRSVPRS